MDNRTLGLIHRGYRLLNHALLDQQHLLLLLFGPLSVLTLLYQTNVHVILTPDLQVREI